MSAVIFPAISVAVYEGCNVRARIIDIERVADAHTVALVEVCAGHAYEGRRFLHEVHESDFRDYLAEVAADLDRVPQDWREYKPRDLYESMRPERQESARGKRGTTIDFNAAREQLCLT